jgi:hypothetical protein
VINASCEICIPFTLFFGPGNATVVDPDRDPAEADIICVLGSGPIIKLRIRNKLFFQMKITSLLKVNYVKKIMFLIFWRPKEVKLSN